MSEDQATVLVVDDDYEMASAVCEVLRQAHYTALSAQSGSEAIEFVKDRHPDLVISDLRMTEMTGDQLLIELNRIAPNLPMVIITAFGSVENAVESAKLGAQDFITKPFGNKQLLSVVSRVLENQRLRQEETLLPRRTGAKLWPT